jgi:heme b synthase
LQGELDTEACYKFIEELTEIGRPILVLTGGEPLYRDDLFDIATFAVKRDFPVALASNGTMVDAEIAHRIREVGIRRVSISLDGGKPETHDAFRGLPGSFEQALEGFRCMREEDIPVQVNVTIAKHNISERQEILDLAVREGACALHLFLLVPVGCGVEIAKDAMISPQEYEETLEWLYGQTKKTEIEIRATCAPHYYRIIRQKAKEEGRKLDFKTDGMAAMTKGCLAGNGVFFVSHRGDVQPCGYLPLAAGNITETHIRDILEKSPLLRDLRDEDLLKGKCGFCEYRKVCAGCRARAYGVTGDYLDEEPMCVYEPKRKADSEG